MTDKNEKTAKEPEKVDENNKLSRDMEIALEAQARLKEDRASAPDGVSVSSIIEDPMDALVRRYVPEAVPEALPFGTKRTKGEFLKGATKRAYWGTNSPENHSKLVNEGWMPVTREIGGKVVQVTSPSGASLLYERPVVYSIDSVARAALKSNERMAKADGKLNKELPAGTVTEDSVTITKE